MSDEDVYGDPENSEFDRGYNDGLNQRPYRPSSIRYAEGYDSGDLAAIRLGKKRTKTCPTCGQLC